MRCLYLGKGRHAPARRLLPPGTLSIKDSEIEWVTVDINPATKPDVVFDLGQLEVYGAVIPYELYHFDEIHAYDVMEHYGQQGYYGNFFRGWRNLWHMLNPSGIVIGACPAYNSEWVWGDPGHTRCITEGTLRYLTREYYAAYENDPNSRLSSYEELVDPFWWRMEESVIDVNNGGYYFAMRKVDNEQQNNVSPVSL